ncbi:WD domain, g-beta repeat domain-containing protein [Ditylenchus destructor]|nr:WD domain, g-beta repeat domain-containing protein [Ditylenchus destructor]
MARDDDNSPTVYEHDSMFIQHDWEQVKSGEKFFLGLRKFGTDQSDFLNVVRGEDGVVETGLDNAKIEIVSPRKIRVQYNPYGEKLFVAPTVELSGQLHNAAVNSIDLSPSGNLIVSGDANGGLKVWNSRTGEVQRTLEGHLLDVNRCRFFSSGSLIASGGVDMTIRIWKVATGEAADIFKGHIRSITDLAILDNGTDIASCSKDGTTKIWDSAAGKCIKTWNSPSEEILTHAVAVNSRLIASGFSNGNVTVYDVDSADKDSVTLPCCILGTGQLLLLSDPSNSAAASMEFTGSDANPVYDFTYSQDVLFSASRDKVIRKYHLK